MRSRSRVRTRVLVLTATLLLAALTAAFIADGLLRTSVESRLATIDSPVELTLGTQSVLLSYLSGKLHLDVRVDAEQMREVISEKVGVDVGDVTMSDGTISAALAGGAASAMLGGDLILDLTPSVVDGELSVAVSGVSIGGAHRDGSVLANQLGPFVLDPAEAMACAAFDGVTADNVSIDNDQMVVAVSVPAKTAVDFADC